MARTETERRELQAQIDDVSFWWHGIDLGDGLVTPGVKGGGATFMHRELESLELPDLRGRSVLDIGAWDGFYSFAAERRGAARVVALDHFVWEDPERGEGRGFEVAHRALDSAVEKRHEDFMTTDLDSLGRFDVVLFLGVLYHLEAPLVALRRLRAVTRGVAVIETAAIAVLGHEDRPLAEFFPADELSNDPTNWWAPNLAALTGMCRAAGFAKVRVVQAPRARPPLRRHRVERYRAIVHAFAA
jgi:tRNA (mo5U34)-methyltransferase